MAAVTGKPVLIRCEGSGHLPVAGLGNGAEAIGRCPICGHWWPLDAYAVGEHTRDDTWPQLVSLLRSVLQAIAEPDDLLDANEEAFNEHAARWMQAQARWALGQLAAHDVSLVTRVREATDE